MNTKDYVSSEKKSEAMIKALEANLPPAPPPPPQPPAVVDAKEVQDDYDFSRKSYRDLVDNGGFTTPVGSFPTGVSHYGCHDMAGNAYEWTNDLYDPRG